MNKDFRVLTTFPRHPKTIKLKRMLGTWEPIITLWSWAAENKPSGNLTGMEIEDIAIASGWDGDPQQLIDALLSVKYLEKIDGAYVLHGWKEHNAFVAYAEKRSEKARLAAQARWDKRLKGCSEDAKECSEHTTKMLQVHAPNPSPSPNPNPTEKKNAQKKYTPDFLKFWDAYPRKEGKLTAFKAWKKANGKPDLEILIEIVGRHSRSDQWQKDNGKFIPHAASWINGKRWEDEITGQYPVSGLKTNEQMDLERWERTINKK